MKSSIKWSTLGMGIVAAALLLVTDGEAGKPESPGGGKGPPSCDAAAVSGAAAAIAEACPCDGRSDDAGAVVPWKNHGQYVRCVARATRLAVKGSDGALHRRCVKDALRCAARSTCGRADGVVNCTTTSGTESSCSFRPSAAECSADGGTAGTGSCCAPVPIGSPSGAFVDGVRFY
jgi:hypothetical protein